MSYDTAWRAAVARPPDRAGPGRKFPAGLPI